MLLKGTITYYSGMKNKEFEFLQIAGALAEEGKSLEEITEVAKAAANAMGM